MGGTNSGSGGGGPSMRIIEEEPHDNLHKNNLYAT